MRGRASILRAPAMREQPVPHVVHQLSSAPSARCTVWKCTMCGPLRATSHEQACPGCPARHVSTCAQVPSLLRRPRLHYTVWVACI